MADIVKKPKVSKLQLGAARLFGKALEAYQRHAELIAEGLAFKTVSDEEYKIRLLVCGNCPSNLFTEKGQCMDCNCVMKIKASFYNNPLNQEELIKCPKGHW